MALERQNEVEVAIRAAPGEPPEARVRAWKLALWLVKELDQIFLGKPRA